MSVIRTHATFPGYRTTIIDGRIVAWSDNESKGAWPNGTRVMKCNSAPGDFTPDGTMGKVMGSIGPPDMPAGWKPPEGAYYLYFVEWDAAPGMPVGIVDSRLTRMEH